MISTKIRSRPLETLFRSCSFCLRTSYRAWLKRSLLRFTAPGAQPGQAGNIHNQIVAYTPERLLVLRNVKAPAGFPHAAEFGRTLTVVALEPIDAGHTRIEISGLGFERGSAPYEALYEAFRAGNSYSLEKLKAGIEALP